MRAMTTISARARRASNLSAWLGVTPFFVFALMFLIAPTASLLIGAFQDP